MKRAAAIALALAAWAVLSLPAAGAQKPANDDCLACHGDPTLTKEVGGKPVSLYVDPAKFKDSIHGSMFSCVDCHSDIKSSMHEATPAKVSCGQCHADEQAAYDRSLHAKAIKAGDGEAATCTSCHGSPHELLPAGDPRSKVNHANIPATCGACHGQKFVMEPSGLTTQPFLSYQDSVHGKAVKAGEKSAAVCTDCHGTHEILPATDEKSPIFKFNVPATCGKCHAAIEQKYNESIHGQAIARGSSQAPVCTDCHGIHAIKSHLDPRSPVSALNLAEATCARCHEGVRLSQEFGFEGRRATTYLSSYHGLASQLGSQVVANCASCHGAHDILPSSDPRSTINPANLVKTCGQCHPGVTERFVAAKVHIGTPLDRDMGSIAVRWIREIYLTLIFAIIGGMLAHNLIIWRRKAVLRHRAEHHFIVRMTLNQRVQHLALLTSFFVLALTGFALKFPDSWLAVFLGMSEHVRGIVHRVAAVVLIGSGFYHFFYLALRRDGRQMLRNMLPRPKDATDVIRNLGYYLGCLRQKPEFERFSYVEKAEYWALVWGTVVMATTGVMLWAKVFVADLLPRWWLDAATAVHFYEAILATLAIFVWHFYFVFTDPDASPMNWAWWDGKMSYEHYREEHGLDAETLRTPETAEESDKDSGPQPPAAELKPQKEEPPNGAEPGGKSQA
jgi:cytochrome b subunit of formate dehydrogenase